MHLLTNPIRSEELLTQTNDIKHRFYASSSEPMTSAGLLWETFKRGDFGLIWKSIFHDLGYAESGGSLDLRTEISKLYGPSISPDDVIVFPGAQTGMTLTALALLDEGDHAIIITPSYQSLEEGPRFAGCDITRVALSPDNGWELDLKAVEAAIIAGKTKYIALNEPHNPSGHLMSKETQRGLIALADKHDIHIFSDEVYRQLELNPDKDRLPSAPELSTKAIALCTMSKAWGAGGTCIGWVICRDKKAREKLLKAQHIFAVCFSRVGEIQAMMALRATDKIIGKNMAVIRENLRLVDQYFDNNADLFEWVRPTASGTGFVKFKGPLTGGELAQELLEEEILVFPPSIFDCGDDLKQYFRIGFSRKTMPASLEAFSVFVEERRAQWGHPRTS